MNLPPLSYVSGRKAEEARKYMSAIVDGHLLSLAKASLPQESPAAIRIRPSGFPYCPILFAMNTATRPTTVPYTSQFYFDVGHAIHELIQKAAVFGTSAAYVFGNWRCSGCGSKVRMSLVPKPCSCCSTGKRGRKGERKAKPYWNYEEVEVSTPFGYIKGHVDMILYLPAFKAFIVVDYKTASLAFSRTSKKKRKKGVGVWNAVAEEPAKFPKAYNVAQIKSYVAMLRAYHGLNVMGWALVYIDRSGPLRSRRDYVLADELWTRNDQTSTLMKLSTYAASYGPVFNIINSGGPGEAKDWKRLFALRPCHSENDFNTKMAPAFQYEDGHDDLSAAAALLGKSNFDGEAACMACPLLTLCKEGNGKKAIPEFQTTRRRCLATAGKNAR